jgi:hypothetical protein
MNLASGCVSSNTGVYGTQLEALKANSSMSKNLVQSCFEMEQLRDVSAVAVKTGFGDWFRVNSTSIRVHTYTKRRVTRHYHWSPKEKTRSRDNHKTYYVSLKGLTLTSCARATFEFVSTEPRNKSHKILTGPTVIHLGVILTDWRAEARALRN